LNNTFDTQALINTINKVKSISSYDDVEVYGWCELPAYVKVILELYNIEYNKIPERYFVSDFNKDVIYILPRCKPKTRDWKEVFNED